MIAPLGAQNYSGPAIQHIVHERMHVDFTDANMYNGTQNSHCPQAIHFRINRQPKVLCLCIWRSVVINIAILDSIVGAALL